MSTLHEVKTWIADELPRLIEKYGVPAAAVAVLEDGEVIDDAAGVLSKATGVEATPDSVFQIGSITKVWTATLVMQLVDEGLLDLDAADPHATCPSSASRDEEAAAADHHPPAAEPHRRLRGRHLHRHRPRRRRRREVRRRARRRPPAVRAGRAVLLQQRRLLRARPARRGAARQAVRRAACASTSFAPLGLTHAATEPVRGDPVPRGRRATSSPSPAPSYEPAPVWALARSNAPAGSMLAMRPRDLLAFAQMHLDDGTAADGTQVLAPGTVAAMQERQVDLPDLGLMGDAWGLGWELFDTPERRGHRPRRRHDRPGRVPARRPRGRASRSHC